MNVGGNGQASEKVSELIRPPSNVAPTLLPVTSGNRNGNSLSFVMVEGLSASFRAWLKRPSDHVPS